MCAGRSGGGVGTAPSCLLLLFFFLCLELEAEAELVAAGVDVLSVEQSGERELDACRETRQVSGSVSGDPTERSGKIRKFFYHSHSPGFRV